MLFQRGNYNYNHLLDTIRRSVGHAEGQELESGELYSGVNSLEVPTFFLQLQA
jgi:hypothetical protein